MAQLIVYGTVLNLIPEINDLVSDPIRKLTEQLTFQVNIRYNASVREGCIQEKKDNATV